MKMRALGLLFAGVLSSGAMAAEAGWQALFNGRDLTGWVANADAGAFTVVDGAIKAHATHPSNRGHLFFVGDRKEGEVKFRNFELVAVVRGEPKPSGLSSLEVNLVVTEILDAARKSARTGKRVDLK